MNRNSISKKRLRDICKISLAFFGFTIWGCGGGQTAPPPVTGPPGPTSGEYLLQLNGGADISLSTLNTTTGALGPLTVVNSPASPAFNSNGNIPGIAVAPSRKFLYAFDTSFTMLRCFSMVGPGVLLVEIQIPPPSFCPAILSQPLNNLVIAPNGNSVYVVESPATIEQFGINGTTGVLTQGSVITETADLREAVIDPAGKFLFAIDLTGGRIFAYAINQASGALSPVPGSPFRIPANGQPNHVVIDSTGTFLYSSLINGGVAAFMIQSSTGALADIPGSPFPTTDLPSNIAIDPLGKFLYVCNFTGGAIDGFSINTKSGALTGIPSSPVPSAASPSSLTLDSSGQFLYVSDFPNSTLFGFSIDSATGSLAPLAGSPFLTVSNPTILMDLRIP